MRLLIIVIRIIPIIELSSDWYNDLLVQSLNLLFNKWINNFILFFIFLILKSIYVYKKVKKVKIKNK